MSALPAVHAFFGATPAPARPFRLPGHARGTRYSAAERARIAEICAKKGFDLFERLDVDEARGDRLVLLARTRRSLS